MRKALAVIMLIVLMPALFAADAAIHIGIISGLGASWEVGEWRLGTDLESSFPFYAIWSGYSFEMYEDGPFREGFCHGASYFVGADISAFRSVLKTGKTEVSLGMDLLSGVEIPIGKTETVLKAGLRLDFRACEESSFYAVLNLPILDMTYAKGFRYPYIRIPDYNWISALTGCRLGYCHSL